MTETQREIIVAEVIARCAHHGQFDKQGMDYILHPLRVAALVDDGCKPAALLHDVLEDTSVDRDLLLAAGISDETLVAVELLTRSEDQTYEEFIGRIRVSGNAIAVKVKIADLQDNLARCTVEPALSDPRFDRLRARYRQALVGLLAVKA